MRTPAAYEFASLLFYKSRPKKERKKEELTSCAGSKFLSDPEHPQTPNAVAIIYIGKRKTET